MGVGVNLRGSDAPAIGLRRKALETRVDTSEPCGSPGPARTMHLKSQVGPGRRGRLVAPALPPEPGGVGVGVGVVVVVVSEWGGWESAGEEVGGAGSCSGVGPGSEPQPEMQQPLGWQLCQSEQRQQYECTANNVEAPFMGPWSQAVGQALGRNPFINLSQATL